MEESKYSGKSDFTVYHLDMPAVNRRLYLCPKNPKAALRGSKSISGGSDDIAVPFCAVRHSIDLYNNGSKCRACIDDIAFNDSTCDSMCIIDISGQEFSKP